MKLTDKEIQQILEGNKLIDEFMGINSGEDRYSHESSEYLFELSELEYHFSWDRLMPVVEKINLLDEYEYSVTIYTMDCHIQDKKGNTVISIDCKNTVDELIKSVYEAVVEFIKWYNQNIKLKK